MEQHQIACLTANAEVGSSGSLLELLPPTEIASINTEPERRPYKCRTCTASFSTLRCLKEHINRHTGIKPHICRLCYKSFYSLGVKLYEIHHINFYFPDRGFKINSIFILLYAFSPFENYFLVWK